MSSQRSDLGHSRDDGPRGLSCKQLLSRAAAALSRSGLCLASLPSMLLAQQVWSGALVQTYTFSDPSNVQLHQVQLSTVPFGARLSLPYLTVGLSGAYAHGIATVPGGGASEISGLTDTKVSAEMAFRRFSVTALAFAPTGNESYPADELVLLGVTSSELLPLAVEAWGAGGGGGAEVGWADFRGATSYSASAGFLSSAEQRPYAESAQAYRPGSQIRASVSILTALAGGGTLSFLADLKRFGDDAVDEDNLFRGGSRVNAVATYAVPLGARESVSVYGGVRARSKGMITWSRRSVPIPFSGVVESASRRLLLFGGSGQATRERFVIRPEAELRVLSSDVEAGGWLATLGARVDYRLVGGRLGSRLVAAPYVRAHLGSLRTRAGPSSGIRGWEMGLVAGWERGQ